MDNPFKSIALKNMPQNRGCQCSI